MTTRGHDLIERHDATLNVGDVDALAEWDALVTTSNGVLQTTEVLVLHDNGKISRHIPGFRGYWGS